MSLSSLLLLISLLPYFLDALATNPHKASSFAGSTSTAIFPPPNATLTDVESYFPNGSQVGYPGPTATGDEAEAIATAPALSTVDSIFPLVEPDAFDSKNGNFDVSKHWGNLTPLRSVKSFGLHASPLVPHGCEVTQVHLLHRHGARYPTPDSAVTSFASKIHTAASGQGFSAHGPLRFLNTWQYRLGAETLTPYGRSQLFNLGVGFRVKYGDLLKDFDELPVFRTTSQARMLDSALNFAAGFFGVQSYQQDYNQLIMIEAKGSNTTLAPYITCPNALGAIGANGYVQSNKWMSKYLQAGTKRLQRFLKGVDLNTSDLLAMQQLCAYETVALGYSAYCDLFTKEEWRGFEYVSDLTFWYGYGPGNPAASAQGIGYVQELVSRLTQMPITSPPTTFNATLVNNNITFPLNQPIYVDASHDASMASIFTAMNFTSLAAGGPLPVDNIPKHQTYNVNQIAPFATNLVGQVLSCPASGSPTSHIRWILNDAVLPLTGIHGCKANKDGLCELPAFVKGMQQRIEEVDFVFDCYANYTIPVPNTIVNGQFPKNLRK